MKASEYSIEQYNNALTFASTDHSMGYCIKRVGGEKFTLSRVNDSTGIITTGDWKRVSNRSYQILKKHGLQHNMEGV